MKTGLIFFLLTRITHGADLMIGRSGSDVMQSYDGASHKHSRTEDGFA